MKKFIGFICIFALMFAVFVPLVQGSVRASENADVINYVSLGDSIAVGYALSEHSESNEPTLQADGSYTQGVFVNDSYAYKIKQHLETTLGAENVNSVTFARSGDTTFNLLEKLDAENVKTYIQNADIITICIGANNILGPALNNIMGFVQNGENSITVSEMENILQEGLNDFAGTGGQDGEFKTLLNKLVQLNSSAKYIFTNVYNPYKALDLPADLKVSLASMLNISNIEKIPSITETYLAGGTNSQGQTVYGLNQIIADEIANLNSQGYTNFYLVDTKSAFDAHTPYSELVNNKINEDLTDITQLYPVESAADPHPTSVGHNLIYQTFLNKLNDFAFVNFNHMGGVYQGKTNTYFVVNKQSTISKIIPINDGYELVGWFTDQELKNEYVFSYVVTTNLNLYAKWETLIFTITFETFGGSEVASQTLNKYQKVTCPSTPTKPGHNFVAWFSDEECKTEYNFDTQVISSFTLYAKWDAEEYTITFNSTGGTSVQSQTISYGEKVIKPEDPTKPDYLFGGWYSDEALNNLYDFNAVVTQTLTLYAKWNLPTFVVSFNTMGGGLIESQTITIGNKATIPETPIKRGFLFDCWCLDEQLKTQYDFNTPVTQSLTLFARWTVQTFTVKFVTNCEDKIASQTIIYGQMVTKPNDPSKQDHIFKGWFLNEGLTNEFNFNSQVTSNLTLYAKWSIIKYVVEFNVGEDVYLTQNVPIGDVATVPEPPKQIGRFFDGWYKDQQCNNLWDFNTPIYQDTVIYAYWCDFGCVNNSDCRQKADDIKTVEFIITSKQNVVWYVNQSVALVGENTFRFTPKGVGTYYIECKIGDVKTNAVEVTVDYITPYNLIIEKQQINGEMHNFYIVDGSYINADKCKWYLQQDGKEDVLIGEGAFVNAKAPINSKVYAVYEGETKIQSNKLQVTVEIGNDMLYIVIAVGVVVVAVIACVVIYLIKRKGEHQ